MFLIFVFSVGLSVSSKGQMSVAGSSDSNMESLVEYHKEIVSKKNDSMGKFRKLVFVLLYWVYRRVCGARSSQQEGP